MNEHTQTESTHSAEHSHSHTKLFLQVFAALCVLTAISFGIANSPLMGNKQFAWITMMVVSCAKAFLVISFFMHLRWERAWKWVLTIPAGIMAILLVLSLIPDIGMRTNRYNDDRWLHASDEQDSSLSDDHSHDSSSNGAQEDQGDKH